MEVRNTHQRKENVPRVHRPCAFDKMEELVQKMQSKDGVHVGCQKQFLTSIPSAFTGCELIAWLIERFTMEHTEALYLANQICQYGYFFPVNDSKNLTVKDDSSLYRFQVPYYWPWQHRTPDNVEYAIYLAKRTLRNKQRHALEDYEIDALNSLRKNLANKWELIQMQAEEQVRLSKDRKKGDKIVSDSQERAFWRVYRPPPGCMSSLEVPPVPTRARPGSKPPVRKRTLTDLQREVEFLRNSLTRTRIKVSVAIENIKTYFETYMEYDPMIVQPLPSNPWINDDQMFWQLNSPIVEVPTEKRVKRWAISLEELMADPTGLQEFTNYLRKEYSHENIRFWLAVKDLRHCFQAQIPEKVDDIFREFLAPGAPCEINIDGKTMDRVHQEMKNPSRFTFDAAAEHVYTLLLKKDCYPRFIRSDHYRNLLAAGVQPLQKKRFFGFGGQAKKKAASSSSTVPVNFQPGNSGSSGGRRRGSDRSLSGSAHELAICGVRDVTAAPRVPHSHSQSNLSDIPYRDAGGTEVAAVRPMDDVCPWDAAPGPSTEPDVVAGTSSGSTDSNYWPYGSSGMAVPQETSSRTSRKNSSQLDSCSSSSDVSLAIVEASDRLRKTCGLQHSSSIAAPSISRNYSIGPSGKVKLSETSRSSINYASSQQSFDLSHFHHHHHYHHHQHPQEKQQESVKSVPEETEFKEEKKERLAPPLTMAPLISISAIVGDLTGDSVDSEKSADESVPEDSKEAAKTLKQEEKTVKEESEITDRAEDAQVVPVWEPSETNQRHNETTGSSSVSVVPREQRDNNVNEVCPWEDEENCRVDTPYVKTYATLGYL
ncbi:regulator of G-protein signaling 9 isoform X2 [Chelonus insularis]|uniref:regulator of G-protein signaling 9 isoform X2 n=1 Tax=Chelonus insularis TaxID=460826 RepID=UPI00158D5064|nr:regulator of G-protein signaling 9 isoform X2 [Chelonus insularis]